LQKKESQSAIRVDNNLTCQKNGHLKKFMATELATWIMVFNDIFWYTLKTQNPLNHMT